MMGSRQFPVALVQSRDFSVQCIEAFGILDHIISKGQPFSARRLGLENGFRLFTRSTIPRHHTRNLGFFVHVDHQNTVGPTIAARFHQEWHHQDAIVGFQCGNPVADAGTDRRMQNRFQLLPSLGVRKYHAAHSLAVEGPCGIQNVWPENFHNFAQRGSARRDHLAGNDVSIDHRNAKGGESIRNSGFARGYAPGQYDDVRTGLPSL